MESLKLAKKEFPKIELTSSQVSSKKLHSDLDNRLYTLIYHTTFISIYRQAKKMSTTRKNKDESNALKVYV